MESFSTLCCCSPPSAAQKRFPSPGVKLSRTRSRTQTQAGQNSVSQPPSSTSSPRAAVLPTHTPSSGSSGGGRRLSKRHHRSRSKRAANPPAESPSPASARLRSQGRVRGGGGQHKSPAAPPRVSRLPLCHSIKQEAIELGVGLEACVGAAPGAGPEVAQAVERVCSYRTRRLTRTLLKEQQEATARVTGVTGSGVKQEPHTPDTTQLGGVVIKTEPADMDEYLQHGSGVAPPTQHLTANHSTRAALPRRLTRLRSDRTVKLEEEGPLCPLPFPPTNSCPSPSPSLGLLSQSSVISKDLSHPGNRASSTRKRKSKRKHRLVRYDALLIEDSSGIPKLTLRRRSDNDGSGRKDREKAEKSCRPSSSPSSSSSKISIKFRKKRHADWGGAYVAHLNGGSSSVSHGNHTKLKIQLKREAEEQQVTQSHTALASAPPPGGAREPLPQTLQDPHRIRKRRHKHHPPKHRPAPTLSSSEEEEFNDFFPLPAPKRLRLIVGKDSIDIDISSRRKQDQSLHLPT